MSAKVLCSGELNKRGDQRGTFLRFNLCGQRFGRLTAIKYSEKGKWLCRCDCGNEKAVLTKSLINGNTKTCGCSHTERAAQLKLKHGLCRLPEYTVWKGMRARCNNPHHKAYGNYGGRGIKVCDRWSDFALFISDMGNRPSDFYEIDRINVNGNYEPGNCRWVLTKSNALNKRSNRVLTYAGKSMCMVEWAAELGINLQTLSWRLNQAGWTVEKALSQPSQS